MKKEKESDKIERLNTKIEILQDKNLKQEKKINTLKNLCAKYRSERNELGNPKNTEEYVKKLEADNKYLQTEISMLQERYESHYKPGNIIKIRRAVKYGEISNIGFAYTKEEFDAVAKEMCKNGHLFVEYITPEYEKECVKYCNRNKILPSVVIGYVVNYDDDYFTVELCSDLAMPACGKQFLQKYTKYDITQYIRLYNRFIAKSVNPSERKGRIDKLISCYIPGKYFPL